MVSDGRWEHTESKRGDNVSGWGSGSRRGDINEAPAQDRFTAMLGDDVFFVPCHWRTTVPRVTYSFNLRIHRVLHVALTHDRSCRRLGLGYRYLGSGRGWIGTVTKRSELQPAVARSRSTTKVSLPLARTQRMDFPVTRAPRLAVPMFSAAPAP